MRIWNGIHITLANFNPDHPLRRSIKFNNILSFWNPYVIFFFFIVDSVTIIVAYFMTYFDICVTATRDCGRVTAILYSRLATRLRSLAIILPIHLYLLSLESTCATVYHNYHTYAYKAERWRTCRYTIIAFQ
jgi:hypothetical protein